MRITTFYCLQSYTYLYIPLTCLLQNAPSRKLFVTNKDIVLTLPFFFPIRILQKLFTHHDCEELFFHFQVSEKGRLSAQKYDAN